MKRSVERILTTHAGSLPRPPDLTRMMWDLLDKKPVDEDILKGRVRDAVGEAVRKQRKAGIDIVSDGEMSKVGFSNYVMQRYSGFANRAQFVATDLGEFPDIINKLFVENEGGQHLVMPNVEGPIELHDKAAVQRDIENLKGALGGDTAGQRLHRRGDARPDAVQLPKSLLPVGRRVSRSRRQGAVSRIQGDCRCRVQSPARRARSGHARALLDRRYRCADMKNYIPKAIEAMNEATRGLPADKVRLHLCWGNYAGPHHHDVELKDIIHPVLKTNAGFIYFEAANPRHAHEWEVWDEIDIPDGKALIPGVIDTLTNHVEHPRLIAQRLETYAGIVGKENVIAGTDCGFGTFVGWSGCDPNVAWLKLEALAQGARLASDRLWKR